MHLPTLKKAQTKSKATTPTLNKTLSTCGHAKPRVNNILPKIKRKTNHMEANQANRKQGAKQMVLLYASQAENK